MHQQPSIGRIVHYTLDDGAVRAGVITNVFDAGVNIQIFLDGTNDDGVPSHVYTRPYSESPSPGCWHWPPRV